jgi:hypothetical protein
VKSTRNPRQRAHGVKSSPSIESASGENLYSSEDGAIWLAGIGRHDDDIMSAADQFHRKQGNLKFGAAGRGLGGRIECQVSVPGQEEEFHAGRLIERAGFPATTSPGATS